MVGVTGFEPAASTSQMSRATNCATPRKYEILCGAGGYDIVKKSFFSKHLLPIVVFYTIYFTLDIIIENFIFVNAL